MTDVLRTVTTDKYTTHCRCWVKINKEETYIKAKFAMRISKQPPASYRRLDEKQMPKETKEALLWGFMFKESAKSSVCAIQGRFLTLR